MGPGRAKLGLKRKDRSSRTTKAFIDKFNGTREERELDLSYVPGPVIIPAFYEATELSGKPTPVVAPFDAKMIIVAPPTKVMHGVRVSLTADSQVFAQMLAKIALGIAVARLGVEGFVPFVRELILTSPSEYGRWVGGFAGQEQAERLTPEFHAVNLRVRRQYIIVEIRLFAAFGGPTNYVVVGRPR